MSPRHFLDLSAIEPGELRAILDDAARMKAGEAVSKPLAGRTLAMIFEKPSTRTRVSFEVAARQLGGHAIVLTGRDMQLGRGESIADTARVLSRYVDAIMIRTDRHEKLLELAEHSTVPVVNGLTDATHPCQIMADVMTFEQHRGPIRGRRIAYVGDGANNVTASLIHGAAAFGFELAVACPPELAPDRGLLDWAEARQARVQVGHDPSAAAADADALVTDVWVSISDSDKERRHALLEPYRVDEALMIGAVEGALFLHCLPAHRGEEVTEGVIDGPASVVFDEAENRLHAQKAILNWCLAG